MKKLFSILYLVMIAFSLNACHQTSNSNAMAKTSQSPLADDCNESECSCENSCSCSSGCACNCNS